MPEQVQRIRIVQVDKSQKSHRAGLFLEYYFSIPEATHMEISGSDVLQISGHTIPLLPPEVEAALERGKSERSLILDPKELQHLAGRKPYAYTKATITFTDEDNLRRCVRLLRWSDDRLRAMGASIDWKWERTYREGMAISFSVEWFDKSFFEQRKDAFTEQSHSGYYQMFGANSKDFRIEHEVLC